MAVYKCEDCGVEVERRRVCTKCYGVRRRKGLVPTRSERGFHSLSDVDHEAKTGFCSICGPTRVYTRRRPSGRMDASCVAQGVESRALSRKATTLALKYSLTIADYERMLSEQDGKCAICGQESDRTLCVDHDHATGKVRDLLCWHCNIALGKFQDDPKVVESALNYLLKHQVH